MTYEKEISVLLPSLRESLVQKRVEEWKKMNPGVNYEIVLVSPFEIANGTVFWVKDNPPFRGSVFSTNQASKIAKGEYIIYFSDDVQPTRDCLRNILNFMKSQSVHPFLGAFKMQHPNGKEIGPFAAYNKLYACYGCISKDDLTLLSDILFRPQYKYSWADIDLSLRVWEKKGEVKICNNAIVIPQQVEDEIYIEHRKKYFQLDVDTFLSFWHNKLGVGLERKHDSVNKKFVTEKEIPIAEEIKTEENKTETITPNQIEENKVIIEPQKRGRGRPKKIK